MSSEPVVVSELADTIARSRPRLGSTRLACIDGPAASGKTTLARHLQAVLEQRALRVDTVHMDDLYEGWGGLDPGLEPSLEQRVLTQVVHPMARGRAARWQRYDWQTGRFAEWVDTEPSDVLVLEGCGSGATAYSSYRTLLVWIEAPRDVRVQRGLERDGVDMLVRWLEWMEVEAAHFARNDTAGAADVRLVSR